MDGKVKSCHSNGLKVLSGTPGTGIPLDEATSMMEDNLIAGGGGVSHTRFYLVLSIQVGNAELLDHLEGINLDEDQDINDQLADMLEAEPDADAHAEGVVSPNTDFDAVNDGGQLHLIAMASAMLAIHALVITEVTDDDYKEYVTPKGKFYFSGGGNSSDGMSDEGLDDIPILVMFEKLLPGGIEETAERMAYLYSLLVEKITPQQRKWTHQRSIKIVTEGDFLTTFLGILIGAVQYSISSVSLWLVSPDEEATFSKMGGSCLVSTLNKLGASFIE
eukprot:scaffold130375_cov50-Attheya_sp.AAC.1